MGSDGVIEHKRNSSRSLKINALRTINRLDDVGPPEVLHSSSSSHPSIVSPPYSHSSSVVLFSLVEQLSAVYEQDEGRRRLLTTSICQSLVNLNIMSPTLLLDELAGLRAHYRQAFLRLVTVARAKLPERRTSLPALPGPEHYLAAGSLVKWLPESLFQYSRYNQEFEEGGYIGGGGFGVVYKSTNRLDGVTYAVKKVFIKLAKQQSILLKIFREVTLLAKLHHPNIVSYKSAWLEPLLENAASSEESGGSQPRTSSGVSFDLSTSMSESGLRMSATVERITDAEELGWTLWPNSVERVVGVAGTPPGGKVRKGKFWVGNDEDNTESSSVVFKEDSESIQFRLDESESESVGGCGDCAVKNGLRIVEPISMPIVRPGVKFNLPMESSDNSTPPLLGGAVLYIQMELCSTTLRAWLDSRNSGGLVDFKHVFCIFQQLLLAVEHLHDNGILHRDVKPRNIFLNGSLDLKLGDFGLAKEYLADEPSTPGDELRDMTFRRRLATGSPTSGVGTQAYASPEQLNSKHVDSKTDVFSLGVVLFELLLPFSTEMERVRCITDLKEGQSDRLKLLQPTTADLITRMTDHRPSHRPSVKEVLNSHFSNKDFHMLEKDVEKEQEMKILRRENDLQKKTIQKQEELIQAQEEELEVLRKLINRVSMSP